MAGHRRTHRSHSQKCDPAHDGRVCQVGDAGPSERLGSASVKGPLCHSVGMGPWAVTTWNVHGSEHPDLRAVARVLQTETPDIVLFQEIRRSQAIALATGLGMRFTWARKHYPYSRVVYRRAEGLAIMTPHALGAAGHTELTDRASHNSWRRRIAQWALVGRSDGSTIRAYNIHLSPHEAPASRRAEAVRLTEIVSEHGDTSDVIVGGDFNDDLDPSVIFALPGIEHLTPPSTNPAHDPQQLLDHVLLPVEARDVSVTVPNGDASWAAISDHLPVTVRFTLDHS
jgi:endonuclease/exonuclease/phosphatase family metal-dependent hydrolase